MRSQTLPNLSFNQQAAGQQSQPKPEGFVMVFMRPHFTIGMANRIMFVG
jgi:hypothetical protein